MTITIPKSGTTWSCEINGKKYSYEAGSTVDVPAEVAELFARTADRPEVERPARVRLTDDGIEIDIGGTLDIKGGSTGQYLHKTAEGAAWASLPNATTSKAGMVKKAAAVADAEGDAPTAAEYNALLAALRTAGIVSAS